MTSSGAPKSLSVALDFEDKGRHFYIKTADEVKHPLSRTLFQALADDEIRHARRIQDIYQALTQGQAWPEPTLGVGHRLEEELRAFFTAKRDALKPQTTQLEGYEFAMQMEKTGIELYAKFAREATEPKERAFFQALIGEERIHLEALQNVHYFLTQPGDWLQEDESHRWNWMNL